MFSNLVESGSHASELRRRGRFFVGTLAFYGLLMAATGIGSVYAYNAHLDEQSDYEVYALLRFRPDEAPSEPARPEAPRPAAAAADRAPRFATRPELSIVTPYHSTRIAAPSTKEVGARTPVIIAPFTSDPEPGGLAVNSRITGGGVPGGHGEGPRVLEAAPPPPPPTLVRPTPTPAPPARQDKPVVLPSSVLTGKAVSKPVPPYPMVAQQVRAQGPVAVQVLVDEQGRVVSARATSGHPLLQAAAVQAARQARFTPTLLNGQAVKVSGVITYNFTLQ